MSHSKIHVALKSTLRIKANPKHYSFKTCNWILSNNNNNNNREVRRKCFMDDFVV